MGLFQLTLKEILELYNSLKRKGKNARLMKVSETDFQTAMNNTISQNNIEIKVQDLDMIHIKIKNLYRKVSHFMDKSTAARQSFDLESVWFEYEHTLLSVDADSEPLTAERQKSPLNQVSYRQKLRRLKPIIDMITKVAEEENTAIPYLMGAILHAIYLKSDPKILHISKLLMNDEEDDDKIDLPVASQIKNSCNLGREKYMNLKGSLELLNVKCLPTWKDLRAFEKNITPDLQKLPEDIGVGVKYKEALEITSHRILNGVELKPGENTLIMEVKDGMDGSGSHSIFNQRGT